jgi:hypothetical protein
MNVAANAADEVDCMHHMLCAATCLRMRVANCRIWCLYKARHVYCGQCPSTVYAGGLGWSLHGHSSASGWHHTLLRRISCSKGGVSWDFSQFMGLFTVAAMAAAP